MILICPNCASRYFVDDAKLGPSGKTVRCAACSTKWLAKGEEPIDFELDLIADPIDPPATEPALAEASEDKPKDPARRIRDKVKAEKLDRDARTTGVIWAGMGAFLIVLAAAGLLFRGSVVELWPRTAGAYASIGLPVNRTGLEFEKLAAHPALEEGRAALEITGGLRNVTGRPVTSPNIEIKLTNPAGKVVAGKLVTPADPVIPPGQVRFFTVTLLDPPSTAKDLVVAFASSAAGRPEKLHAPSTAEHVAPALRPAAEPAVEEVHPVEPAAVEEIHPAH